LHALAVTPRSFERQVSSLLRRRFRPVPADELLTAGRRSLHVTFDDAYADILPAVSVLEQLRVPATIFASTSYADDGRPLDVPELAAEAAANPERLATMRWDELGELAARGFTIGSHTVSHPHLTSLSDAELDLELGDSRAAVEDHLRRPCKLLAYPYGEHDARVQAAASRCGYTAAFALRDGASRANIYALPRIDLYRGHSLLRTTVKTAFVNAHASPLLARSRRAFSS
jgi:peptidoglycan/xylan/chitin deacetylase (PgdA/CDA1 family)